MSKLELNFADYTESMRVIIRFISKQSNSHLLKREFLITLLASEKVGLKVYDGIK
jgi:hypothetical protein